MLPHNIQAQDWHSMSVMWRWLTAIGMDYLGSSPMNTIRDNCLRQEQESEGSEGNESCIFRHFEHSST